MNWLVFNAEKVRLSPSVQVPAVIERLDKRFPAVLVTLVCKVPVAAIVNAPAAVEVGAKASVDGVTDLSIIKLPDTTSLFVPANVKVPPDKAAAFTVLATAEALSTVIVPV